MNSDLRVASTMMAAQADPSLDTEVDPLPLRSDVSWEAVAAGAVSIAALTLLLVAFGAGLGLSAVSPGATAAFPLRPSAPAPESI
jgi:hypothetical protein